MFLNYTLTDRLSFFTPPSFLAPNRAFFTKFSLNLIFLSNSPYGTDSYWTRPFSPPSFSHSSYWLPFLLIHFPLIPLLLTLLNPHSTCPLSTSLLTSSPKHIWHEHTRVSPYRLSIPTIPVGWNFLQLFFPNLFTCWWLGQLLFFTSSHSAYLFTILFSPWQSYFPLTLTTSSGHCLFKVPSLNCTLTG